MSLQSKWAQKDSPADSKTPEPTTSPQTAEPQTASPATLVSKWATPTKGIPSPPPSAGTNGSQEPSLETKSAIEAKLAALDFGKRLGPQHRKDKDTPDPKKDTVQTPSQPKSKHDGSLRQKQKLAPAKDGHGNPRRGHESQPHLGDDHRRQSDRGKKKSPDDHRKGSKEDSNDDRGPVTAGARALAMRIGVPANKDKSHKSQRAKEAQRTHPSDALPKREMDQVDEAIKAEVQAMFDKMSDKSTNWADLEDD